MKKPHHKDQLSLSFDKVGVSFSGEQKKATIVAFPGKKSVSPTTESDALRRVLTHAETLKRRM